MTWIPPGPFGPISIQTQLDGSGNGYVSFQANGRNARLTRVVVAVATSVKQASVSVYKGQIGTSNFIGSIVSGSTGGIASGQIDLTDGQTCYITWTGGDANAIATATFSGNAVELSDIGNDSITWTDPIAASDGTLVFPAIQSANFVAGTSGWTIRRDGSFEFGADGTIRSNVNIVGTDGSQVALTTTSGAAEIDLMPPTNADPTVIDLPATIRGTTNGTGSASFDTLDLDSPRPVQGTVGARSLVSLQSGSPNGTVASAIILQASTIDLQGSVTQNGTPLPGTWVAGAGTQASGTAVTSSTPVVQMTAVNAASGQPTFIGGHYYSVRVNAQVQTSAVATAPILEIRKNSAVGTRYKWARIGPTVVSFPYVASFEGEFQVGSNQAASIVLCLSGGAGQTVQLIASTDNPNLIDVYDMGPVPASKALYLPVL